MAGIWERVVTTGDETQVRINVSLLRTELLGIALGVQTKAGAQANIESELGESLTGTVGVIGTEVGDLDELANQISQGATQSRLVYGAKLEWGLNAAELALTDETTFRSTLDIPLP